MGYGTNLKKYLDEKGIRVPQLERLTGISKHTIYTMIKRDSPARYDHALKISYALGIPLSDICNTDPYAQELDSNRQDKEDMEDVFHRCFANQNIMPILVKLGRESKENLPKMELFLGQYYQLTDEGRREVMLFMEFIAQRSREKLAGKILSGDCDK